MYVNSITSSAVVVTELYERGAAHALNHSSVSCRLACSLFILRFVKITKSPFESEIHIHPSPKKRSLGWRSLFVNYQLSTLLICIITCLFFAGCRAIHRRSNRHHMVPQMNPIFPRIWERIRGYLSPY